MPRPGLSAFFSVVEIRTKLVSVSTLLLAACYVVWRQGFPPVMPFILMWAATLAVDMGTTAFNNYFDYWRGTDSYREVDETDKVLVRSGVDPAFAFWSAFGCFTVAVFLGLAIACLGFWWVVPAGAVCMAVGFFYTGGPFPISRTPFGELFAGGCLGFALFLIACGVWSLPPDAGALLAALPSGFWIASILTVNNTCDIAGDRAAGRRTLSILLGPRGGELVVVSLDLAGAAAGIIASLPGILPRFCAVTLSLALVPVALILLGMHKRGYSHATKGANMRSILACFLWFSVCLAAGYLPSLACFPVLR